MDPVIAGLVLWIRLLLVQSFGYSYYWFNPLDPVITSSILWIQLLLDQAFGSGYYWISATFDPALNVTILSILNLEYKLFTYFIH